MNFLNVITKSSFPFFRAFLDENMHHIQGISAFLEREEDLSNKGMKPRVTPDVSRILSVFSLVSMDPYDLLPNSLKVVFLFQDVYPTPGAACGIATATLNGRIQPTLSNMFKRLSETYKGTDPEHPVEIPPSDGDIRGWCTQGVLPINCAFTTREGEIKAHMDEWAIFSAQLVKWLSDAYPFLVFVLFGKDAQQMKKYINRSTHAVLETSHPSGRGYYAGFDKCDIFNEVNERLRENSRPLIRWENHSYDLSEK